MPAPARPRPLVLTLTAGALVLGALVFGAAAAQAAPTGDHTRASHAAPRGADPSDAGLRPVLAPGAGQTPAAGGGVVTESGTTSTGSLPAGGLAAALVLAGAGTVLATRAMCSGRGWR